MKRLNKITVRLACVLIFMFNLNSPTLICSAAPGDVPLNREELLGMIAETQAEISDSVTIPCQGYIVPLGVLKPNEPSRSPVVQVPVPKGIPKTGDTSNMELFTIIGLASLLLLLLLMKGKKRNNKSTENTLC